MEPKSLRFTSELIHGPTKANNRQHQHQHHQQQQQQCIGTVADVFKGVGKRDEDVQVVMSGHQIEEVCDADTQRASLVLSGVNFHLGTPITNRKKKKQKAPLEGKLSCKGLSKITEMTSSDKQRIQDELSFPQKYSIKRSENNKDGVERGVDNLAYTNTEDENTQNSQSNVTVNIALNLANTKQCENDERKPEAC